MKFITTLLLSAFSSVALANENPAPSADVVAELKQYCTEMALEEEIAAADLPAYLLKCVNEELESEDYAPVEKL